MEGEFTVTTTGDTLTRSMAFVREWQDATAEADIEIRGGETLDGKRGLVVTLNGQHHAFTTDEARILVQVVQSALNKFPDEGRSEGLPNLIAGLTEALQLIEPN